MARVEPALTGRVSAVGGVVRDALLGRPHGPDLDLVVEDDMDGFVGRLDAEMLAHPRFGTASASLPGGTLDVNLARRERYAHPGALPHVEPGTIDDDLARRDFTVNAMALRLSGPGTGELIDPHGGLADLEARTIRILRPDALTEDPSRIVRAARYAARLGFSLEPGTEAAARAAAPGLDLGSARVAGELRRLLEEPEAVAALEVLARLGVPWIGESAGVPAVDAALGLPRAPDVPPWAARLGVAVAPTAAERAALPGWAVATAREMRRGMGAAAALGDATPASTADRALRALRPAGVLGALAVGGPVVARWWERDRARALAIDGSDLVRAGVAPGPAIGRALAEVRAALLDDEVSDGFDDQLGLALRVARGHG